MVTKLLGHMPAHVDRGLSLVAAKSFPDTGTGALGFGGEIETSCLFDYVLEFVGQQDDRVSSRRKLHGRGDHTAMDGHPRAGV